MSYLHRKFFCEVSHINYIHVAHTLNQLKARYSLHIEEHQIGHNICENGHMTSYYSNKPRFGLCLIRILDL